MRGPPDKHRFPDTVRNEGGTPYTGTAGSISTRPSPYQRLPVHQLTRVSFLVNDGSLRSNLSSTGTVVRAEPEPKPRVPTWVPAFALCGRPSLSAVIVS